ncbi:hypothetical protein [Kitasatospora sp. NPDC004531]
MTEDVLERPLETGGAVRVAHAGPWGDLFADLARELTERQVSGVELALLGSRDELTAGEPERRGAWPVPVHLYGHHATVGPDHPAAGGQVAGGPAALGLDRWPRLAMRRTL